MVKVSLKGLWAHKRRMVSTVLAVFLGVAFLSGTIALGDTMRANFSDLLTEANAGTDAVVRRTTTLDTDPGEPDAQRGLLDDSLVGEVAAVTGVAVAEGSIEGYGQLLGNDGDALGGNGPPTLAGNWIDDPELNPYEIAEGRAPRTAEEVVINRGAAEDGDLDVGDTTTVLTPAAVEVEIVGIATFGSEDGIGASTYAAFTLGAAQEYLVERPDTVSSVVVRAEPGVPASELTARIGEVLPAGAEVITGDELASESIDDINEEFLDMLRTFLTIFAAVALLVATFSIYNTFSILVAQRGRESALLRALGAGRAQVLGSVAIEAVLIGVVASGLGILGGFGIAGLLKAMFDAFGFALPAGGLVFRGTTVATGLAAGIGATVVAAVAPAVRASRVAPLAALRDVAVDRSAGSLVRAVAGAGLASIGVAVVLSAVLGSGANVLARAGLGALLTLVGVVVFGPVVARPASAVIGAPLPALRGLPGSLARQNAMRNPRRTSGTAAALMVGVGVVTLFTVFAASLKSSLDQSVSQSFQGDLVISTGPFGGSGLSPELATDLAELAEVEAAQGIGRARVAFDGDTEPVGIVDPGTIAGVLDLDVAEGSIEDLGAEEVAISDSVADENDWEVGTPVAVTFVDGETADFEVGAVYDSSTIVGEYVVTRQAWAPHAVQDVDSSVLIALADGVSLADGRAAVEAVAADHGAPDVEDAEEYVSTVSAGVDTMLGIVYVMLALAIVIALMGIANTLSLSIHERTRELGLLRAVGQTRRQLRSMIRGESVVIAVFGTIGGLGLGVFLGWALVQAASGGPFSDVGRFSAPVGQLLVVLAAGAVAGVLAGVRPARGAARLDVLRAIATE
ncbi:MAG TPA: FtsX-like permease family protein [Acidimicrobiia bacterium]